MSISAKARCTAEWREKTAQHRRTKINESELRKLYELGATQQECAIKLGVGRKVIENAMKRLGIKARIAAKRDQWGDKNTGWKGPSAGLVRKHRRLYRAFGQPSKCDACGTEDKSKTYDWANLTGDYDNPLIPQPKLRVMHLFAGAGGGILSDLLLGHQCICAVEINSYCQQILHARQKDGILPWFPIFADVKEFDGKPWAGVADIVAGGFPCQDISVAGKGVGLAGARSGLWSEFSRIIREVLPAYVFVENSPMLTLRGLDRVLGDLAPLGYDARWGVLSAADVGAPHLRERIWILAYSKLLYESSAVPTGGGNGREWRDTGGRIENHTPDSRLRGGIRPDSDSNVVHEKGSDNCAKENGEASDERPNGLLGYGAFWRQVQQPEPLLCRVGDGLAYRSHRLAAIGNGQVPICAAFAWKILSGMA